VIEDCTAIILAGGDSRRMGSDKAELKLGGQTLLQRVAEAMRQVFPDVIVSVRQPRPGIDLPQVCDERSGMAAGAGPLAGLAAGLAGIATPWAFLVACDMPFVVPALVELLGRYRAGYQAVVPVVHGHRQVLAAYYAGSALEVIHAQLASGTDCSLRAILEQLRVRYVDEAELLAADPGLRSFFDLDTPQDVELAVGGDLKK
jgi:molybdopterin-guanine dinucleotide biosynthesis protein A